MDPLTLVERRAKRVREVTADLEIRKRELNAAIYEARQAGHTLRRIADAAGISFKGVDNIVANETTRRAKARGKP